MDANDTYMKFLKIYYPDTANSIESLQKSAPQGKTPKEIEKSKADIEAQINSKLNNPDYIRKFNAYENIPQGLRALYSGTKVPDDMMELAERNEIITLMEWEKNPNLKQVEEVRKEVRKDCGIPSGVEIPTGVTSAAALVLFASAVKAGYSEEACQTLALQSQHRENLLQEKAGILTDSNLSEDEKKKKLADWLENKWLKSKRESVDTIKKDRFEHQPEKHLIYMLNKFNRGKVKDTEMVEFNRDLAETALKISTEHRQDILLQYLKDHPSILRHYKKPTLDKLATLVLDKMPEAEREQFLAHDIFKKYDLKKEMSADKKAASMMEDSKKVQTNDLPKESALSAEEHRTNVSPKLRRGGVEREA